MRSVMIGFLITVSVLACRPLNNRYGKSELSCGVSGTSDQLVKIRSLNESEYNSEDLAVFRRTENAIERVPVTPKGCFIKDSDSTYLIAAKNNFGAVLEKGQTKTDLLLETVQDSDLNFSCPSGAISSSFDFQQQFNVSGDPLGFSIQFSVKRGGEQVLEFERGLGSSPMDFLRGQSDGSYKLDLSLRNILKGTSPRAYSCDLNIDNLAPTVQFESPATSRIMNQGYRAIDPSEKIRLKVEDASKSRVLTCWVSVAESTLALDPESSCELKDLGAEISPPSEGYWILHYQAIDEAQQRSPILRQKILVYQEKELQNIELELQLADLLLKRGDNYQATRKIVRAESKRRKFASAFERQKLEVDVRNKLFNAAIRSMPRVTLNGVNLNNSVISPDGRILAALEQNEVPQLCAYDFVTGKLLWKKDHPNGLAVRMIFNFAGTQILTTGEIAGDVFVWSTQDGELVRTLKRDPREGFRTTAFYLGLTADDRYLGVPGFDDYVYIYDLSSESEEPITKLGQTEALYSFALSPDGQKFATTADKRIKVHSREGAPLEEYEAPFDLVATAFLSSDELVFAVRSKSHPDDRQKLENDFYYKRLGDPAVKIAEAVVGGVDSIVPSPDRRHFMAIGVGSKGGVLFKNWRDPLAKLLVGQLSSLPYERADGGNDTLGLYWAQDSSAYATWSNVQGQSRTARVTTMEGNEIFKVANNVDGLAFSPNGRSLSIFLKNKELQLWDLSRSILEGREMNYPIEAVDVRGDKYLTVEHPTLTENLITVWDRKSSRALHSIKSTNVIANSVRITRFVGKDSIAYFKDNERLEIFNLSTGSAKPLLPEGRSVPDDYGKALVFAVSADGRILAIGSTGGYVELVDIDRGASIFLSKVHSTSLFTKNQDLFPESTSAISFVGTSNNVVSCGADGKIFLHKQARGEAAAAYTSEAIAELPAYIISAAASQRYLAVASLMNSVLLLDLEDSSYQLLPVDGQYPLVVAISPNEEWVASTSFSSELYLWNRKTGERITRLEFAVDALPVNGLNFSEDSQEVMTGFIGRLMFIPTATETVFKKTSEYIGEPAGAE